MTSSDVAGGRSPEDVLVAAAGFRLAAAIRAAAALHVGEALADGGATAAEVAARTGADAASTAVLLRALASEGVIAEHEAGTFALGTGGAALLPASRGGFRELIVGWATHPAVYRGLEKLDAGIAAGRPAFEVVHDAGFFAWLAAHPDEEDLYQRAVGGHEPEEFDDVMDDVDFGVYGTVADIGGGGAGFLEAIVRRWPHVRGILVDLPTVAATASARLIAAGLSESISTLAADCRVDPLPAADCYGFSTVLRYFPDDVALRVLENVAAAAAVGADVLLVEMPQPDGVAVAPGAMKSLVEHALSGGRDRTVAELDALLDAAGFDTYDRHVVMDPYWVVRARRR